MTREKLLSLSNNELIDIAQKYAIDVDGINFDRDSLITDLLEEVDLQIDNSTINASVKRYEFDGWECGESMAGNNEKNFRFPEHYNESSLYFLLRDPYWAFAHWELDEKTRLAALRASNFNGFFLRLSCLKHIDGRDIEPEFLDISIDENCSHRFIQLINPQMDHRIAIFADLGGVEAMIMVSQPLKGSHISQAPAHDTFTLELCRLSE
jgi:hypothetical protein